jgi:ATP phosphoribosyltransferase regulatory subunit
MSPASADVIETYLRIDAPAPAAATHVEGLMSRCSLDLGEAFKTYHRRLYLLAAAGIDPDRVQFQAEFGRNLEYYTGFVFEVMVPALGPQSPIAGGGRYDGLLRAVGAPVDVPAVGAMIHTERLLSAANGART